MPVLVELHVRLSL